MVDCELKMEEDFCVEAGQAEPLYRPGTYTAYLLSRLCRQRERKDSRRFVRGKTCHRVHRGRKLIATLASAPGYGSQRLTVATRRHHSLGSWSSKQMNSIRLVSVVSRRTGVVVVPARGSGTVSPTRPRRGWWRRVPAPMISLMPRRRSKCRSFIWVGGCVESQVLQRR